MWSVCWAHGRAVQIWLNRSGCCLWEMTDWAQGIMLRWGRDPPLDEAILGLSSTLKSTGILCCGVCSKRNHSVLNNGITAWLLQLTALLPTGWCRITLYPVQKSTHDAAFHQNSLTTWSNFPNSWWWLQLQRSSRGLWKCYGQSCKKLFLAFTVLTR